jgi:hypothetical protein
MLLLCKWMMVACSARCPLLALGTFGQMYGTHLPDVTKACVVIGQSYVRATQALDAATRVCDMFLFPVVPNNMTGQWT